MSAPGDVAAAAADGIAAAAGTLGDLPATLPPADAARLAWLSDYAARHLSVADPDLLDRALAATGPAAAEVAALYAEASAREPDNPMRAIRLARHAAHVAVLRREWTAAADVRESFAWLSASAMEALHCASRVAEQALVERHGHVHDSTGRPVVLAILAMGKLGGGELNFSSDVDLVFLHGDGGESSGPKPLNPTAYFTRWAREIVRLLDQRTADGFAYRVDVRLRPFGSSGPLVSSLAGFESYLETQGRDWERYAYLKACLVDERADPEFELRDLLDRFVYRRYLDFGIFASLRDLKARIEAEVRRRDRLDDIKLGPGGIREIEFVVQSLQLIRGGREPALKQRHLPAALQALEAGGHIDSISATELGDAYRFLRRVENAVQGLNDEQTHRLPLALAARQRVAAALGFDELDAFERALARQRERVQRQFNASELGEGSTDASRRAGEVWPLDEAPLASALREAGVADAAALAAGVAELRRAAAGKRLDELSEQRFNLALPLLLDEIARSRTPAQCWQRLGPVLEAVLRRSAYLALLIENSDARRRLIDWLGRSGFLAAELAASPMLLDELLGAVGATALNRVDMVADLETLLRPCNPDDAERMLQHVAEYQRIGRFRIALRDEAGEFPVMRVSDALTALAEATIETVHAIAWQQNIARYGVPQGPGPDQRAQFCVVGYGKLGGVELGYGSDLDLVFLHDSTAPSAMTNGAKPLANDVFFTRHVRKLIHYLTYQTAHGPLYDVDVRLRPSGRSGLLVTGVAAFERYQRDAAWTWEHQALLRSRAVVGDPALCERYEQLRVQLLREAVRRETLREDVASMRARMRRELSQSKSGEFDIKQDAGGIADIEFLVQYLILRDADAEPGLLTWSDNMRQLDQIAGRGRLPADDARRLQDIYLAYRELAHERALDGTGVPVSDTRFRDERALVTRLWQAHFGD